MENIYKLNQYIYKFDNNTLYNGKIIGIQQHSMIYSNDADPEICYDYLVLMTTQGFVTDDTALHDYGAHIEKISEHDMECRWFTDIDTYTHNLKTIFNNMFKK